MGSCKAHLVFLLCHLIGLCWETAEEWNWVCHLPIWASKPEGAGVKWQGLECCSEILPDSSHARWMVWTVGSRVGDGTSCLMCQSCICQ